jgi:hypothetical protein
LRSTGLALVEDYPEGRASGPRFRLETADIVLLLISSDFLASDDCYDVEMTRALELSLE